MKCKKCGRPLVASIELACNHGEYSDPEFKGVHLICYNGHYRMDDPAEQCSNQDYIQIRELGDEESIEKFIAYYFKPEEISLWNIGSGSLSELSAFLY